MRWLHLTLVALLLVLCEATASAPPDTPHSRGWTLLWLVKPEWERNYLLNQLLRFVPLVKVRHCYDKRGQCIRFIRDRTLITINKHMMSPLQMNQIVRHCLRNRVSQVVLLVLSDEGEASVQGCDEPYFDQFPLVIRNYFRHDCAAKPNVLFAPLGIKDAAPGQPYPDIASSTLSVAKREYAWSFQSSRVNEYRTDMLELMRSENLTALVEYGRSGYKRYVNAAKVDAEYQRALQQSMFAPSPEGHSPETWRLYEALESGAIPVVTVALATDYLRYIMPCSVLTRLLLSESPAQVIAGLVSSEQGLSRLEGCRITLLREYATWRDAVHRNIARRIAAVGGEGGVDGAADALPEACAVQRESFVDVRFCQ